MQTIKVQTRCVIPTLAIFKVSRLASFCIWAAWFESYLVANLRRHIFPWCGSILTVTIFNHQNVCRKFFLPVLSVSWQLWGICEQLIGLICLIWEGWQIKYKCCGNQTEILTDIHYVCYIYKKKLSSHTIIWPAKAYFHAHHSWKSHLTKVRPRSRGFSPINNY